MSQKGLTAGFVATVIALVFGTAVGGLGMWNAVAAAAKTPVGGWLVLLVIGTALGYLYSFVTHAQYDKFFGKELVVKGVVFGVVVWIVTLILASIFPVLGEAAFAQPIRATLFLQFLTHLVWGASLGLLYQ